MTVDTHDAQAQARWEDAQQRQQAIEAQVFRAEIRQALAPLLQGGQAPPVTRVARVLRFRARRRKG